MELREPKRKKKARLEPKSSLPLVFGSKGELTKFHANLTALGSCIADPTEMEIIHKMGYFGKGSLSRSYPVFGKVRFDAPPIIRERQWERRQYWINEVQKLSKESYIDNKKKDEDLKPSEKQLESEKDKDEQNNEKDFNNDADFLNTACESGISDNTESVSNQEKRTSDIEILDNNVNNIKNSEQNGQTSTDIDEVIVDSTEEEDICEITADNFQINNFEKSGLFGKDIEIQISSDYHKDISDLQGKVIVLPDSDSDTENYLTDIKPKIKHENFPVRETLHLTFEETFFLMYGLGCLRLIDFDGKYLSIGQTWDLFCKEQKSFLQKYVTYHYFRSKGWVVKPALKYGGDFLLYKEGPSSYHSSYIVIIDVLDAVTFKRLENKTTNNMMWKKLIGLQRLAETVSKEILFAQVLWPATVPVDVTPSSPEILSQFTVKEVLWRRWKANIDTFSANAESIDDFDDDDYSL